MSENVRGCPIGCEQRSSSRPLPSSGSVVTADGRALRRDTGTSTRRRGVAGEKLANEPNSAVCRARRGVTAQSDEAKPHRRAAFRRRWMETAGPARVVVAGPAGCFRRYRCTAALAGGVAAAEPAVPRAGAEARAITASTSSTTSSSHCLDSDDMGQPPSSAGAQVKRDARVVRFADPVRLNWKTRRRWDAVPASIATLYNSNRILQR